MDPIEVDPTADEENEMHAIYIGIRDALYRRSVNLALSVLTHVITDVAMQFGCEDRLADAIAQSIAEKRAAEDALRRHEQELEAEAVARARS